MIKRIRKLTCVILGHDPVVVWPIAVCRRCPKQWGKRD